MECILYKINANEVCVKAGRSYGCDLSCACGCTTKLQLWFFFFCRVQFSGMSRVSQGPWSRLFEN